MDYIKALCAFCGRVEKLPDLMYKFKHTHQYKGQRLSDYDRVGRILHQIFLKKGIDPWDVGKVRLKSILQGARPNHPFVLRLLLKRMQVVPTSPELLKVVREEEVLLNEKNQGFKQPTKDNSKVEKVSAQVAQVERSALEEDNDEETGECFGASILQSVAEASPVELFTHVVQDKMQQTLL